MTTEHTDPTGTPGDEIVVAVDGSVASRAALSWAVRDAATTGRRVCAVRVFDPTGLFAPPAPVFEDIARVREAELQALRDTVSETVGEAGGLPLRTELLEGDPADQLTRRSDGAALLVMGSHGRTRLGSTLLGSVSAACIRRATCPVLIMPPRTAEHLLGDTAADRVGQQA